MVDKETLLPYTRVTLNQTHFGALQTPLVPFSCSRALRSSAHNVSWTAFLDYNTSGYGCAILSKQNMIPVIS